MQDALFMHVFETFSHFVDAMLAELFRVSKAALDNFRHGTFLHQLKECKDSSFPVKHVDAVDDVLAVKSCYQTDFIDDVLTQLGSGLR